MHRLAFSRVALRNAAITTNAAAATLMATPAAPTAVQSSRRQIYTNFASIACEPWAKKESWIKRLFSQSTYRSFEFHHTPLHTAVPAEAGPLSFSKVEAYLLSSIEDDTNRLLNLSWAYDFDPYWEDVVYSHTEMFKTLYKGAHPFRRIFLGNHSNKMKEMEYIEKKLNRLRDLYEWARVTERIYTSIYKTRYMMQRTIFNQLERERYLAGCVDLVEEVRKHVPAELEDKIMSELDVHLTNLRHWTNGCPVAKTTFTRRLA